MRPKTSQSKIAKPEPPKKPVPSPEQLANLSRLQEDHERVVTMILEEEEDVITTHKSTLDDFVDSIKTQMNMIGEVDQPGSDIQNYVGTLSQILAKSVREMTTLQTKVDSFGKHLKEEAVLSNKYYSEKAVIDEMQGNSSSRP